MANKLSSEQKLVCVEFVVFENQREQLESAWREIVSGRHAPAHILNHHADPRIIGVRPKSDTERADSSSDIEAGSREESCTLGPLETGETLEQLRAERTRLRAALAYIARATEPGIDQSDDELEQFIARVRDIAIDAMK